MDIEISQIILNCGMTFLTIVTAIVIAVVGYFVVKLIIDLSELSKNLTETSIMLNTELKPALKELNETMHSVNTMVQNTDKGVGDMKINIEKAFTKTKEVSGNIFGGFLKGFLTVYSLFKKK